jgi:hypothetical protein
VTIGGWLVLLYVETVTNNGLPGGPNYLATHRSHIPGDDPRKRSHVAGGRQSRRTPDWRSVSLDPLIRRYTSARMALLRRLNILGVNGMGPIMRLDLKSYRGVLPYASELFGVYQPLLGWKSQRHERRFARASGEVPLTLVERLGQSFGGELAVFEDGHHLGVEVFRPATKPGVVAAQSALLTELRRSVDNKGITSPLELDQATLADLISDHNLEALMKTAVADQINARIDASLAQLEAEQIGTELFGPEQGRAALAAEAGVGSALAYLRDRSKFDEIRTSLVPARQRTDVDGLLSIASLNNPLEALFPSSANHLALLDPNLDIDKVALSPIGVVHLFRQYFFELDTFLGTPVGHVWVSPGTTLELVEVSTRRTVTEKILEQSTETSKKTEQSTTDQDELSEAIKQDNEQNMKFGSSVTSSFASVSASANFDMANTQKLARETVHKHTRQQSDKLSSELRQSFKSTFRTMTETTDTTSKRYVIQNLSTDKLQNYELRRKMRQVVVQVQDVGTYLCWQTYVDNPGDDLDTATLVHVAQPADLGKIPHPDAPAVLDPVPKTYPITFQYENTTGSDERDVVFYQGDDREGGFNHNDRIVWERDYSLDNPGVGYTLDQASLRVESNHSDICSARVTYLSASPAKVRVSLDQVNFADQSSIKLTVSATWNPPPQDWTDYNKKFAEYTEAKKRVEVEAYYKAVQERIELASKIRPRPAEELREEERIVVYRHLLQDMLMPKRFRKGSYVPNSPANWHVLSELLNSMFDIDKMLYFVAPEWWKPTRAKSSMRFGQPPKGQVGPVSAANSVGWDEQDPAYRDRYHITDKSEAAKLGSSLGWVLQLDGDNSRNAFLNAPWVKAVIPIRPGQEKAALNWLQKIEGTNGISSTDIYEGDGTDDTGNALRGLPLVEVLNRLAASVAGKHVASGVPKEYSISDPKLPADPTSTVTATPVDRVWEHGFNPLAGGFQAQPLVEKPPAKPERQDFQVFDQWTEIVPTDQIVPVPVEYDAKTGRLL